MVSIYPSIHSSFQLWFFFVFFLFFLFLFLFFLRGGDVRGSNFSFFFYFFFFKVNLLIHITFALLKYNTKRNLMFYQSISVKHRLFCSVLWQYTCRRGQLLLVFSYSCVMISVTIFALNPRILRGILNNTWNRLLHGYVFLCSFLVTIASSSK